MEGRLENDPLFSEDTELRRELGLLESFSIVFGRIIGSGIFRTPALIMIAVGGYTGLFYSAWIIGGIATLLGAFCFAEMVAMMPRSGGPYAYLRAAYPPVWAFLRGWAMFFVSETAVIVTVSLVFAEYGNIVFENFFGYRFSFETVIMTTFAIIWILTAVNCIGVRMSGIFQNVFAFLKLSALVAIIVLCFTGPGSGAHFTSNFMPKEFGIAHIAMVGAALQYSFFAYSGWEGATYVAEEVKNPRRNLPLSILLGIGGVMLLYLAVNSAYLYALPVPTFIEAKRHIASKAMTVATGTAGGVLIAAAVMISTFGNVGTQILAKGRTWYSMARDGLFPSYMARLHENYRTPNNALITQAVWASVLLLSFTAAAKLFHTTSLYSMLIRFFSFTSAVFNTSTFLAVWILRKKYPDVPRPYRVWGYPYTLILVLLIQATFMLITLYDAPGPSLLGIVLTLSGLLYYYSRNGAGAAETPPWLNIFNFLHVRRKQRIQALYDVYNFRLLRTNPLPPLVIAAGILLVLFAGMFYVDDFAGLMRNLVGLLRFDKVLKLAILSSPEFYLNIAWLVYAYVAISLLLDLRRVHQRQFARDVFAVNDRLYIHQEGLVNHGLREFNLNSPDISLQVRTGLIRELLGMERLVIHIRGDRTIFSPYLWRPRGEPPVDLLHRRV